MQNDPTEEWRRLTGHYAGMYDGELIRLAREYTGLTETAQQVLRDEMLKRGLGGPRNPEKEQASGRFRFERGVELDGEKDSVEKPEDGGELHDLTWKTELCECETGEQAWQLREVLQRAGIESWIQQPGRGAAGSPYYLIQVAADQLEEARAIAAQPIPQDIIEDSKVEVPEYDTPKCPGCGDPDPTLLAAEPVNRWGCETCGHEWNEAEQLPAQSGSHS